MWGDYPVLYKQEYNHKVTKWGRERQKSQNQQESIEKINSALIADSEGGRKSQVSKGRKPLEDGKAKKWILP